MTFHLNLLNDNKETDITTKYLRGLIGEEVAAYLLRKKLNLCVVRPSQLISSLESANLKNPMFQFLKKYQQTMDFIGAWPSVVDLTGEHFRTSIRDLFTQNSLTRSIAAEGDFALRGYVIEVKSSALNSQSRPKISPRQTKMVNLALKLGFEIILAHVIFLPNYETRARFFNGNEAPIDLKKFDLPKQ
ncbi:MAG: hypothetical protein ACXAB4_00995 [Candidatus Hodarchaeales archaeon]|jgi:hypothetical protein